MGSVGFTMKLEGESQQNMRQLWSLVWDTVWEELYPLLSSEPAALSLFRTYMEGLLPENEVKVVGVQGTELSFSFPDFTGLLSTSSGILHDWFLLGLAASNQVRSLLSHAGFTWREPFDLGVLLRAKPRVLMVEDGTLWSVSQSEGALFLEADGPQGPMTLEEPTSEQRSRAHQLLAECRSEDPVRCLLQVKHLPSTLLQSLGEEPDGLSESIQALNVVGLGLKPKTLHLVLEEARESLWWVHGVEMEVMLLSLAFLRIPKVEEAARDLLDEVIDCLGSPNWYALSFEFRLGWIRECRIVLDERSDTKTWRLLNSLECDVYWQQLDEIPINEEQARLLVSASKAKYFSDSLEDFSEPFVMENVKLLFHAVDDQEPEQAKIKESLRELVASVVEYHQEENLPGYEPLLRQVLTFVPRADHFYNLATLEFQRGDLAAFERTMLHAFRAPEPFCCHEIVQLEGGYERLASMIEEQHDPKLFVMLLEALVSTEQEEHAAALAADLCERELPASVRLALFLEYPAYSFGVRLDASLAHAIVEHWWLGGRSSNLTALAHKLVTKGHGEVMCAHVSELVRSDADGCRDIAISLSSSLIEGGRPELSPAFTKEVCLSVPESTRAILFYNCACAHAVCGEGALAAQMLTRADVLAPGQVQDARKDSDFDAVREHPAMLALWDKLH